MQRITWHPLHNVTLRLLVGQWDGRHEVSAEVDTEDGDGAEWQRYVGKDEHQKRWNLRNIAS